MTKEEFLASYAERSGMTVDQLLAWGLHAEPCDCGEEGCQGWQMLHGLQTELRKELGVPIKKLREISEEEWVAYHWIELTTASDTERHFVQGYERTPEERFLAYRWFDDPKEGEPDPICWSPL